MRGTAPTRARRETTRHKGLRNLGKKHRPVQLTFTPLGFLCNARDAAPHGLAADHVSRARGARLCGRTWGGPQKKKVSANLHTITDRTEEAPGHKDSRRLRHKHSQLATVQSSSLKFRTTRTIETCDCPPCLWRSHPILAHSSSSGVLPWIQ